MEKNPLNSSKYKMQQHCLEYFDNLMLIFHMGWIPTSDFQVSCGNCDASLVQVTGGSLIWAASTIQTLLSVWRVLRD